MANQHTPKSHLMNDELSRMKRRRRKDRKLVSGLLSRELVRPEVVHHEAGKVLVLCRDQAQHAQAQQEVDALKACGHRDWRRCNICGEYSSPDDLHIYKQQGRHSDSDVYHPECKSEVVRNRRAEVLWTDWRSGLKSRISFRTGAIALRL